MRSCDCCGLWPGTVKRGELRLCDDCCKRYELRRTGHVLEVIPRRGQG